MVSGRNILGLLFSVNNKIYNVEWSHDAGIPSKHVDYTLVTLMTGDENGASGVQPAINLYDDNGYLLGHRSNREGYRVDKSNDLDKHIYKIEHNAHKNKMETPKYVVVNQWSSDAICLSALQVSNGRLSAVFYGDLGAFCGQSWYFSRRRLSDKLPHPKCVWIDEDHTADFNARAISFHLNDMLGTPDKVVMYRENPEEYLCKSTPRFAFWKNLLPDSHVPIFRPPLQYERDEISGQEGRDKDPRLAIDKVKWDKDAKTDPQPIVRRSTASSQRKPERAKLSKRQGTNHDVSHLVVTRAEGHEASAVCNSTTSYGWDVVSLREETYCDMTVKQLYNLCGEQYKENCFDLERKVLVGHGGINARGEVSSIGVPEKRYESTSHWEE